MARAKVTDPGGAQWRVWRRWYAWRRWVTLGDIWRAIPGTSGDGRYSGGDPISDFIGFIIAIPFLVLGAVGLVVTLVDLVAQLIALPFVLLARLLGLTTWPVQLDQAHKHIRTDRVRGFGRAGDLRDQLVVEVREGRIAGRPVAAPPAEAAPAA